MLIIAYFGDGVKAESSGKSSGEGRGERGEWKGGRREGGKAVASGEEEGWKRGRMGLESRGLVDFLIRDVGGDSVGQAVDFSGEVIVFAVHL